ncbi:MAG: putative Spermidine synthase-like protein [Acidobacteria bacterium]|nr:putative Spermidine synthase-like protein [Acidobacteriota bacterium]
MPSPSRRQLAGVALVSATLLMTELALTRIFSVVMYYHFAFLAISIALFGVSASGVFAYVLRRRLDRHSTDTLLAVQSLIYAVCTIVALFWLVRLRVGMSFSPRNLALMLTIYALAALPFFSGGLVVTLAIARLSAQVNAVYAADLIGAAGGCLILIPLLDRLGAPGVVLAAAALSIAAAILFAPAASRARVALFGLLILLVPIAGQLSGRAGFDVVDTKGHQGDRILFSKWNSFSRIGVYERTHGDWSLSPAYKGPLPDTRFMDIDSAASTPILRLAPDLANAQYLRYELTALAYHLVAARRLALSEPLAPAGFSALVIGPGGGRDLASALVFGALRVDGVEINPIIANDVMRDRFRDFSGGIYTNPRVRIAVDDGRSFVRRTPERYDVIQASLVDTWAATAAGAYTLTENSLYTVDAFNDYLDHLTDGGVLTITRWVADGLRLVSLAQEACAQRGWPSADRLAVVRQDRVATFLLKKTPFTAAEIALLRDVSDRLGFDVLYVPGVTAAARATGEAVPQFARPAQDVIVDGAATGDYARLITAPDRQQFYDSYRSDIRPTTDDRPFFFHTTKIRDQLDVAFGQKMLFGNGLSALMTLLGISGALVVLFVILPLGFAGRGQARPRGWLAWLVYFGALGAGFMLIEVSVLQRFVLLLGHPVYSLTVTLFSLLLGTGLGAAWSRRLNGSSLRRSGAVGIVLVAAIALIFMVVATPVVSWAIPFSRSARMLVAAAMLVPIGVALGIPMPTGMRMLSERAPQMLPWAWGMNGALSVLGATLAIFIAMNWGFRVTLLTASGTYLIGLIALLAATHRPT